MTGSPQPAGHTTNFTRRQLAYWREESLHPDAPVSQILFQFEVPPRLAIHLEQAWELLAPKIDSTRARFCLNGNLPWMSFENAHEPLQRLKIDPGADADQTIFEWMDPHWTSFRPDESLVRNALFELADGRFRWTLTASHLVADFRSMDLFIETMIEVMDQFARGEPPDVPEFPSFESSMQMQRQSESSAVSDEPAVDWAALIGEVPPFRLFGVDSRTATVRRNVAHALLARETVKRIEDTCQRPGYFFRSLEATMANFFTALTAVWSWRHGGHRRMVFGIAFHGRAKGEERLFGFKSEVLPMTIEIDPDGTFADLVCQIHERAAQSLRNRNRGFANPAHRPLIQAQSNFIYNRQAAPIHGAGLRRIELPRRSAEPEAIHFMQLNDYETDGAMLCVLWLHSSTDRFTEPRRLGTGYAAALDRILDQPGIRLGEIRFDDPEYNRWLERQSRPGFEGAHEAWITRWAESLREFADVPAVIHGNDAWSHAKLHAEACRWSGLLERQHFPRGAPVIVWSRPCNSQCAAWIAVLSNGLVYVPLHEQSTLTSVIERARALRAALILTEPGKLQSLRDAGLAAESLDASTVGNIEPLQLTQPPPDSVAYLFHTSGTTGQPKAIAVSHRALGAFMRSWIDANGMERQERLLHLYAITFDPWLSVVCAALWLGGTSVAVDAVHPPSAAELTQLLERHRITSLCTPTAYFHALCEALLPDHLRRWIVGGEALAADRATKFLRTRSRARLVNAYGPTETTIWSGVLKVDTGHGDHIPIGGPLPSCGYRVCDETGMPTPFGVPGELWISGPQVAEGYVGQPELTTRHFVERDGLRWYRTGDLVRWRQDGNLDFLGRIDRQVQIRGYRVEPAEIELALRAIAGIKDAAVGAIAAPHGLALCAWIVQPAGEPDMDRIHLKAELLRRLPEYKVPRWFINVPALAKSNNGKVDIAALPGPQCGEEPEVEDRLPSLVLWDLRVLFEQVLRLPRIGINDDFFDLGGDSLLLVELLEGIRHQFGITLDATRVIENPSIGSLAPLLETGRNGEGTLVVELKKGTRAPLFCIPGAGGIGVEYYALSRRLPGDQPVVGLRSSGTDGRAHAPRDLDTLLEEHVDQIVTYRTERSLTHPVHLMGYSLGGIFAWEVAHRLEAKGIPVGEIFLIDSHAATEEGRRLFQSPRTGLRGRLRNLLGRSESDQELIGLRAELDSCLEDGRMMDAARLGRYNLAAQARFYRHIRSRTGDFSTTYFLAQDRVREPHARIWRKLTPSFELHEIPGTHDGEQAITREPQVAPLADVVIRKLTAE